MKSKEKEDLRDLSSALSSFKMSTKRPEGPYYDDESDSDSDSGSDSDSDADDYVTLKKGRGKKTHNLKGKTKAELQDIAREHGLSGFSTLNKDELIKHIKDAE